MFSVWLQLCGLLGQMQSQEKEKTFCRSLFSLAAGEQIKETWRRNNFPPPFSSLSLFLPSSLVADNWCFPKNRLGSDELFRCWNWWGRDISLKSGAQRRFCPPLHSVHTFQSLNSTVALPQYTEIHWDGKLLDLEDKSDRLVEFFSTSWTWSRALLYAQTLSRNAFCLLTVEFNRKNL